MTVTNVIRKFGETTSIRGIPRALKTEDKLIAVIWWLSVVTCSAVLVSQLTLVIMRYYRYGYTTTSKEGSAKPVFPDITICNTYPLHNVALRQARSWSDYQSQVLSLFHSWPLERVQAQIPDITDDELNTLWLDLLGTTGYYTSLNAIVDPNDLSFLDYTELILAYKVFDWSWMENSDYKWRSNVKVKWDPNYYQCYTIRVPDNTSQNIRAVTLVVYLDDFDTEFGDKFDMSPLQSMSSGIRMSIHGRGTVPDLKNGLSAGPGTETTLSVSPIARQRLPKPHHGCRPVDQGLPGASKTYTADECAEICLQNQIISHCQCLSSQMAFTPTQLKSVDYNVCGNLTSPVDGTIPFQTDHDLDGFRSLYCLRIIQLDWNSCKQQCDWPCFEYVYEVTSTQSTNWPHKGYQLALYEEYIKHETYKDKFAAYHGLLNAVTENVIDKSHAAAQLQQLSLIADNFLQVNVILNAHVSTIVNETEAMSVEVLWSNIGGVLSLWLGLSIMTVVELIELICVLVRSAYDRRQTSAVENTSTVPDAGQRAPPGNGIQPVVVAEWDHKIDCPNEEKTM